MDFKALMMTEEYDFLRSHKRLGDRMILLGLGGSYAYGTNNEKSDIDFRGITLPLPSDILGLTTFEQYEDAHTDTVIYSFNKTLLQFHRGNATLFEWSNSPVIYKKTKIWEEIYERSRIYFSEKAAVYHYYGTAKSTYKGYLMDSKVKYKKYFYALRPLLACRYIEQYHRVPPVLFEELLGRQKQKADEIKDDRQKEWDTLNQVFLTVLPMV